MKIPLYRYLLILAVFSSATMTGCSQPVPYSESYGFSMPYPRKGDDVHSIVEALLNRWADPHLTDDKFNGAIVCEVKSARVMQTDSITPRPDGTTANLVVHAHTIVHFPNGQNLDTEHCDSITGYWYQGHLRQLGISAWCSSIDGSFGTPLLDNLEPGVVAKTQDAIRNSRDLVSLQYAVNLPISLYDLLYHFRGHDVVHIQYDFTAWQRANQIAMQYVDAAFGAAGGPMPWEQNGNHAGSDSPPPSTTKEPAQEAKPVTDEVTIAVTAQISFSIPVTDPKWATYENALPQFPFDSASWSAMAQQGASRIQMEKRLFVEINSLFEQSQKRTLLANQPLINELVQAGYVAKQSGASLREINLCETIRAKDDPILDRSTKYLVAMQILLRSIQNDITSQTGSG